MKAGEIPDAYWAAMTHLIATTELRRPVFGDVYMLSHLVEAANRSDIRRLVALERENADLKDEVDRQHARLRDAGVERERQTRRPSTLVEELSSRLAQESARASVQMQEEVAALRKALRSRDQLVGSHTGHREAAERLLAGSEEQLARTRAELDEAAARVRTLQLEVDALERQLEAVWPRHDGEKPGLAAMSGRRIL